MAKIQSYMRVGDDNVGDMLIGADGCQNRLKMRVLLGAGVDHRQTARAQNIGVGAAIGHR